MGSTQVPTQEGNPLFSRVVIKYNNLSKQDLHNEHPAKVNLTITSNGTNLLKGNNGVKPIQVRECHEEKQKVLTGKTKKQIYTYTHTHIHTQKPFSNSIKENSKQRKA